MSSEYEKKLIKMQYDMQENQAFMADYFKDLEKWTDEVKKKEEAVKNAAKTTDNEELPPVRHLAPVEKKRKKRVKKSNNPADKDKKTSKIKAYDYRNWDKFDVDKACEEVDTKKSSESEYTTDEEWEMEQLKIRADWEKERGNLFLRNNQLDEAINCYTRAIDLDPNNAIYLANRALCLIKQEKYAAAEVDCTLSISIDKAYVKAYLRRGTSRFNLKKYEMAIEDFKQVLKLEPTNKQAKEEVMKIEGLIESRGLVYPIEKSVEQRSKKPLKQIMIEEINDENSDKIQERLNEINSKIKLNTNEEKLFNIETKPTKVVEKQPIELITEKQEIDNIVKKVEDIKIKSNIKTLPGLPSNGYQFRKDWLLLSNNIDDLTAYFKQISPDSYSKLFMNGLESDMLSKILKIFKNLINTEENFDLYLYMKCLSDVKRFQTQFLFLSSEDIQNIKSLFEFMKSNSKVDESQMESLKKLYQC